MSEDNRAKTKNIPTLLECIYNKLHDTYVKNNRELQMKGISDFSGYVTYLIEEMMQNDETFARYAPKLEKISFNDDKVILKDSIQNRIAEVVIQRGELFCNLCDKKDCVHIEYVFSLPDVYEILKTLDISFKITKPIIFSRINISKDRISFDPERMELNKGYEFHLEGEKLAFVRSSADPTKIMLLTQVEDDE
ncbi:hypothetical protein YTPLAS73_13120 [Nitrosarchaeum sp.]|nr:hypothetical protein YTPLAS73_13120 [Nitrosarchaeum sp.]